MFKSDSLKLVCTGQSYEIFVKMNHYKTYNSAFNYVLDCIEEKIKSSATPEHFHDFVKCLETKCSLPTKELVLKTYEDMLLNEDVSFKWNSFLIKIHKTLSNVDNMHRDNLKDAIFKCETHLKSLDLINCNKKMSDWFTIFCSMLKMLFSRLLKRISVATTKNIKNQLTLYAVQITTCATLIFYLFSEELSNKILMTESRRFLQKRITYIFDGIRKILDENTCPVQDPGFLQWMDNSLDLLNELYPNNATLESLENVEQNTRQVLCHAMSIAKICCKDDTKKVTASVQAVLREFEQLKTEFKKPELNPSFVNLYIDLVSDKLCILESRVNTTVLNMFLNIFSDPLSSLKQLQNVCEESDKNYSERCESDLDELIETLDIKVDSMIQIGLFAIACSTNNAIVAQIRNCLASLEYLECELVPALLASYMENCPVTHLHAKLFAFHWENEVLKLRENICFIIDPVAFGQVVHEDLKTNIESIQEILKIKGKFLTKDMVNVLANKVKLLIFVVDASVKDMKISQDSEEHKHVENLKKVHEEVLAASKLLTKNYKLICEKVVKRILILSTMVQRVVKEFTKMNNSSNNSQSETLNKSEQTITDLEKELENISLESLEKHGTQILKNRSVLYKTHTIIDHTKLLSIMTPRNLTSARKAQIRKIGLSSARKNVFKQIDDTNDTLDLTKILEDLTGTWNATKSFTTFKL